MHSISLHWNILLCSSIADSKLKIHFNKFNSDNFRSRGRSEFMLQCIASASDM